MPEDQPKPELEEDDASELAAEKSKTRSAIYVDAFLISILDKGLVRLTFAEGTVEDSSRIRAALVMPANDVKELVRILNSLLGKLEKQQIADQAQ